MMRKTTRRAIGLTLILLVALGLSGCYRSVGGSLEPTEVGAVAQVQNTSLPFPTDSLLDAPTAEIMTELPSPIAPSPSPFPTLPAEGDAPDVEDGLLDGQGGPAEVAAVPTQTAVIAASFTPVVRATSSPTQTPPPSQTPLPSETPGATATATVGASATFTPVPFLPLLPSPTYTPFYLSPVPVEAQPLAERPVAPLQPQDGQGGAVLMITATPAQVAQAVPPAELLAPALDEQEAVPLGEQPGAVQAQDLTPLSTFQLTSTQIVFNATATAAALQGILIPTFTPAPGQLVDPLQPGAGGEAGQVIYITATPAGQAGICDEHLISPGETLSRIALTYGVTTAQIAQANNIVNPDLILAGDTILIPCPVPATPAPLVTQAPAAGLAAGQGGFAGTGTYTVEPGDNLYRISLRFGVTMAALMSANGLSPATMNSIYAGQQLVIPGGTAIVQPTLTPAAALDPAAQAPVYIVVTATPG